LPRAAGAGNPIGMRLLLLAALAAAPNWTFAPDGRSAWTGELDRTARLSCSAAGGLRIAVDAAPSTAPVSALTAHGTLNLKGVAGGAGFAAELGFDGVGALFLRDAATLRAGDGPGALSIDIAGVGTVLDRLAATCGAAT
jgi:hypothetical protein